VVAQIIRGDGQYVLRYETVSLITVRSHARISCPTSMAEGVHSDITRAFPKKKQMTCPALYYGPTCGEKQNVQNRSVSNQWVILLTLARPFDATLTLLVTANGRSPTASVTPLAP
jgi:hypothetical protein